MNLTESPAEKKKILNLMVKRGDKPEDAKKEIDKNYDYIKRTYNARQKSRNTFEFITIRISSQLHIWGWRCRKRY